MKQSRFTETQIIGMLKEQESGSPTAEVCRKHGISSATFHKYKARFGATAAKAITDIFGTPGTENERGWLQELRDASDNSDPRITAKSRTTLRGIFG